MKEKRILYAIGYVNDSYIEEMYKNENASTLKRSPRRILLIAAIIALGITLCIHAKTQARCEPVFIVPYAFSAKYSFS